LMLNRMMRKALADLMNAPVDVPASFVVKIVPSSNTPSALHATITVEHKRVKLIKPTVDEDEIELPASTVTTKESGGGGGGGSGGEDK
jgi:hypothetical protein